jgi:cytochrome c biogenesis protein CcmG/thiol:disulfide interchange protein DsbE
VRPRMLTGLSFLAVIGAVAVLEVASSEPERSAASKAPALPTEVITPPKVTVAGLRGKPAAINFWASWCTPCRREAPELEQLHRSRNSPGSIVGVNLNDRLSAAHAFIRDHRWTFPTLRDSDGAIGRAYEIVGLPTTVILDSSGRIATVLSGPQTVGTLRAAFDSTR